MSQTLDLQIKGLYFDPNPLSEVPKGALFRADNLVIDKDSTAETRRGLFQYGTILTAIDQYLDFGDVLFVNSGADLFYDSDNLGTWIQSTGVFTPADSILKLRSINFNSSLYLATSSGIQKLDVFNGTAKPAGVSQALDLNQMTTGITGFMGPNTRVAYRVLWGYRDVNNLLLLGSPSARQIAQNTAVTSVNVTLNFTVPSDITLGYFYQIYRSEQTLSATDTPSDDLQLVIEQPVTAGQIAAGTVTILDSVTDDLKGAFIYTAPTQQGILQSNNRPPFAVDMTEFRQFVFYANTFQPNSLINSFYTNAVINDTITLAGTVYTAKAVENIAANEFVVGAAIPDTMRSFIKVVNRSASNTLVYAYELTETAFKVQTRLLPGAVFTFTSSNATLFSKALPQTSDTDAHVNRVLISKLSQADAVPILNFLDFGSAESPIRRIIALRDAVFVIKDDGVFRINGTDLTNFTQEPHDLNTTINGVNTAVRLNNSIFMMSDAGITIITTTGTNADLGRPIENYLLRLAQMSNFQSVAWSIGYESDKKFILAVPTLETDTYATQLFVFNFKTLSWTRWIKDVNAGIVNKRDNKLYLGRVTDFQTLIERKTFTVDDYADDEFPVTLANPSGFDIDVTVGTAEAIVGRTLKQGTNYGVIVAVNGVTVTMDQELPFIAGAATVFVPIDTVLQWIEEDAGNPGIVKHWSELSLFFRDAAFDTISLRINTNFNAGFQNTELAAASTAPWGGFPWSEAPWGGAPGGFQAIRTYFPKETTMGHWVSLRLDLSQAFTSFSLAGVSIILEGMSPRFR